MGVNKIYNVYKGLKKGMKAKLTSADDTITGMKPTTGQKGTRNFKIGVASKKVNKQVSDLTTERNKRSKELFKDK